MQYSVNIGKDFPVKIIDYIFILVALAVVNTGEIVSNVVWWVVVVDTV